MRIEQTKRNIFLSEHMFFTENDTAGVCTLPKIFYSEFVAIQPTRYGISRGAPNEFVATKARAAI